MTPQPQAKDVKHDAAAAPAAAAGITPLLPLCCLMLMKVSVSVDMRKLADVW
jgi:hypothetical protein